MKSPATPPPWTRPSPPPDSAAGWSSAPGTGSSASDLNLGGSFHRSRMRLISSQVSSINPELTGRWDKTRRYHATWQMLAQVQPARFITQRFPIAQAAQAYELIDSHPEDVIQVILTY